MSLRCLSGLKRFNGKPSLLTFSGFLGKRNPTQIHPPSCSLVFLLDSSPSFLSRPRSTMNPFSLKSPQRPTITLTMPSKTTLRALSHTHPHSLTHKEPSTPLMTTVEKEEELTSTPSSSGVLAATTHHHLQEGHTALMNERYEEALHHYQRSIQIQPTSEGYYHLGNVYVHLSMSLV